MSESNFKKLENKLAHRKGVTDPAGLAYHIGVEKYGKKGMERKAAAGRDDLPDLPEELQGLCESVEQMRDDIDRLAEHVGVEVED